MECFNDMMYVPSDEEAGECGLFDDNDDVNFKEKASKNIVRISYSILNQNKEYFSTTPVDCKACAAILSMYSKVLDKQEYSKKFEEKITAQTISDEQRALKDSVNGDKAVKFDKNCIIDLKDDESVWVCEFCGIHNRVPRSTIVPQGSDELYLLKRGNNIEIEEETATKETTLEDRDLKDDTNLVFCIDMSGSMSDEHAVNSEQYKNVKSVKRLTLIADAVLKQVESMHKTHPNRKVGLVAFDDRIFVYGDCTTPKTQLKESLDNFQGLLSSGEKESAAKLKQPLMHSFNELEQAIKALKPEGTTALGPALLCSLGLVKHKPGSRVIICTDGLANVGLGSLSGSSELSENEKAFYRKVGDIAVESGVSISIITVQGNVCRVDALGPLTDRTAGTIMRVDPANVDLSQMAANSIIATNVRLKAILHEGLAFQNTNVQLIYNNGSILMDNVGSVTENNEVFFEYRVKNSEELKQTEVSLEGLDSIPLQAQITYNDLKGNEFVRVISKRQELTREHEEANKEVKTDVLAGFVQKESANLALAGKEKEAKEKNEEWTGFMKKVIDKKGINEEEKKKWNEYEKENQQLCLAIEQNEVLRKTNDQLKKDENVSKLYKAKQMKFNSGGCG